jgi:hypothetical protein
MTAVSNGEQLDCQLCLGLKLAWERVHADYMKTAAAMRTNVPVGDAELSTLRRAERIAKLALVHAEFDLIRHRYRIHAERIKRRDLIR